ncbi:MAG: phosphoribosylamine--glycine ligase [Cytophagales bacterium]|nr:phosphoribosylamine--glycine ligase [Cytophagales bacterium]
MNVLVLGSGGREHAMAWKIRQSPLADQVFVAPGNGGTSEVAINLNVDLTSLFSIKSILLNNEIDLLVVGPEDPLVNGLVNDLIADDDFKKLKIIGPERLGAQLEGSKEFSKRFMEKYKIPTAGAKVFDEVSFPDGLKYLDELEPPYVLKADGLAGGKGVIITEDVEEAKDALDEIINQNKFGDSGSKVLIEEFLTGIEVSFFILTDGKSYRLLPEAKDYKRIGENDEGLNTGGMGAISPVKFADRIFKEKVHERIIKPTIAGLKKEKIPYTGFLFFGLINVSGEPYIIEYNVRLGDPETQAILPRIKTDFLELLVNTAEGNLIDTDIEYERYSAATVVCVSEGYPETYETGVEIVEGKPNGVLTFHAGSKVDEGTLVTNGGRVLAVTGLGKNLGEAISKGIRAAEQVRYKGKYFRSDIGLDLTELGQ